MQANKKQPTLESLGEIFAGELDKGYLVSQHLAKRICEALGGVYEKKTWETPKIEQRRPCDFCESDLLNLDDWTFCGRCAIKLSQIERSQMRDQIKAILVDSRGDIAWLACMCPAPKVVVEIKGTPTNIGTFLSDGLMWKQLSAALFNKLSSLPAKPRR